MPPELRREFVSRSCAEPQREQALHLLSECERIALTSSFLDSPAVTFAEGIIRSAELSQVDLHALRAELAGRYTIERELGRGGMATVYLARDERHARLVAIKVLHAAPWSVAGSATADRFRREIGIAARLTHPHIVSVHDSGTVAGGLYFVMPYVSGESLRALLARSGPLPLTRALSILRDVARALAHAHREGIVHRDIKPGNILLHKDGDALVADFGIARALSATAPGDASFVTPAYCAPEELAGSAMTSPRADLFSLGVMAFELLAGERPFPDGSPGGASPQQLAAAGERLLERRPDVPRPLVVLVMRLMSRDAGSRPAHADEVLRALDSATVPASTRAGRGPVSRRQHTRVVALLLVLVALVVGALVRPTRPSQAATGTEHRGTAVPDAYHAYQRGRYLLDMRRDSAALAFFQRAVELDPSYARAHAGLAEAYTNLAVFGSDSTRSLADRARDAVARALAIDSLLVEALAVRAHQLFVLDCNWSAAANVFARAMTIDSLYVPTRRWHGLFLHERGEHQAALTELRRARELAPTVPGAETLLGRVFVNLRQPESALVYLRSASAFNSELALAHQQMAHAYLQLGEPRLAIASMRRAAEMNPRDSARLAYVHAASGNTIEARRILAQLEARESRGRSAVVAIAMANAALGDVDEAFRWLDRGTCLHGLAVSAGFEGLRGDPRFGETLRRTGLEMGPR